MPRKFSTEDKERIAQLVDTAADLELRAIAESELQLEYTLTLPEAIQVISHSSEW